MTATISKIDKHIYSHFLTLVPEMRLKVRRGKWGRKEHVWRGRKTEWKIDDVNIDVQMLNTYIYSLNDLFVIFKYKVTYKVYNICDRYPATYIKCDYAECPSCPHHFVRRCNYTLIIVFLWIQHSFFLINNPESYLLYLLYEGDRHLCTLHYSVLHLLKVKNITQLYILPI